MAAKRRAKQYFNGRHAGISRIEIALALAVIVGLGFVTARVLALDTGPTAPVPAARPGAGR